MCSAAYHPLFVHVSINHAGRLVAQFHLNFMYPNDGKEYVSIQSSKYSDMGWYLTVNERRKFRGSVPMNNNDIFERVQLQSSHFALRSVFFDKASNTTQRNTTTTTTTTETSNTTESNVTSSGVGSGSGSMSGSGIPESVDETPCSNASQESCTMDENGVMQPVQQRECYLGFSQVTGRAGCYNSIEHYEVHLVFVDVSPSGSAVTPQ